MMTKINFIVGVHNIYYGNSTYLTNAEIMTQNALIHSWMESTEGDSPYSEHQLEASYLMELNSDSRINTSTVGNMFRMVAKA